MNERRRTRVTASKKAITITSGGVEHSGTVENISLKGCLLDVAGSRDFENEAEADLVIHLEEGNPEFDIRVKVRIVRVFDAQLAIDFTEVANDSFSHLLRYVQYNAEDPEAIEAELARIAYKSE